MSKRALILGAKSDIAQAIAAQFARAEYGLTLACRNSSELSAWKGAIESDYGVRCSLLDFDVLASDTHRSFYEQCGTHDVVVMAVGYLGNQATAQKEFSEAKQIIDTNLTGVVSILEIIAGDMESRQSGSLLVISSVAGERGKMSNYTYGAAKAGLTQYLAGLRQRLTPSGVHVMTIKPGFVKTRMTEGMDLSPKLTVEPAALGKKVFRGYLKKQSVVYSQGMWRLIMFIIRHIPELIYKKLEL